MRILPDAELVPGRLDEADGEASAEILVGLVRALHPFSWPQRSTYS